MIEWKRRYGKYKPLKQPAKCLGCNQKAVHQAYHQLCPPCAGSRRVCAKCMRAPPAPPTAEELEAKEAQAHASLESRLGALPERQRRTAQRQLAVGAVPVSLTARIERSHGPTAVVAEDLAAAAAASTAAAAAASSERAEPAECATQGAAPAGGAAPAPPHSAVEEADAGDVTALLDAAVRRALLSEAEADRLTDAIASGARSEEEVAAEWEWAARLALPTGGAAVDPRPSSE